MGSAKHRGGGGDAARQAAWAAPGQCIGVHMPEPISTCPSPTFSVQQRCCYHSLHHPKATSALVRTFSKPTWHRGMASALFQVMGGSLALSSCVFLNSVHAPDQGFCSLFRLWGFICSPTGLCAHWPDGSLCVQGMGLMLRKNEKKKRGGGGRGDGEKA